MRRKKRRNNLQIARAFARGSETLDSRPNFLILDTSSRCNLRCPMCWQTLVPEEVAPRVLLSRKALSEASSIKEHLSQIIFHGSGEPLLNPDLTEIISGFRGYVGQMEICTNGTAITKGNATRLLTAELNTVRFSCDGDNQDTFERLRQGADFDRFLDNVRLMVALKEELGARTHLGFNVIVSGENWEELPGIVTLAETLGLDFVAVFAYITMGEGRESFALPSRGVTFVRDFLQRYRGNPDARCYLMVSPSLDVTDEMVVRMPDEATTTKSEVGAEGNRDRCGALYSMMNIKADGTVYPCCMHPELMGDLNTSSIEEVWNGHAYAALRTRQARGEFDEICLRCFDGLRYETTR